MSKSPDFAQFYRSTTNLAQYGNPDNLTNLQQDYGLGIALVMILLEPINALRFSIFLPRFFIRFKSRRKRVLSCGISIFLYLCPNPRTFHQHFYNA